MARVAVLVVTMDTRDDVLACLESLQGEPDIEIAVLDNVSGDGTADAIRERYPDVRVIEAERRAGFGANNNVLIRATTAPYVYLLNPDTVSQPGSVAALADVLDANPAVAAVGPRVVFGDGREQDTAWRFPSPLTCVRSALTLGRGGITQSGGEAQRPVEWAMACALHAAADARWTRSACSTRASSCTARRPTSSDAWRAPVTRCDGRRRRPSCTTRGPRRRPCPSAG